MKVVPPHEIEQSQAREFVLWMADDDLLEPHLLGL